VTSTSTTYAAPTTGTAVSVPVTTTSPNQKVLITLSTKCINSQQDSGCYVSFVASGGLTQAASDNFAVGSGRPGDNATSKFFVGSGTYLVTIPTPGTTTFTAQFKLGAAGNTATFSMHAIYVQVFG
jgi:hypothetical protein